MIIDVSYANRNVDYARVKGMIIRIGYRGSIEGKPQYKQIVFDDMYEKHLEGAKKYNIPHSFYFFPTSINVKEAEEEARWLIRNLPEDYDYPIFLDSEKVTGYARADGLSKSKRTQLLKVICDILLDQGIPCGIYASQWWLENNIDMNVFPPCVVENTWCAQNPKLTYKGVCALWQYGTKDIGCIVDVNEQLRPFNMTGRRKMGFYRDVIVNKARSYVGASEGSSEHKAIIDAYNAYGASYGYPRGYKMTMHDAWCATFVSAVAIKCGYTEIIPVECSCPQMVKIAQAKGIWQEDDAYVPKAGDIILYDWEDASTGDNKGNPDHIGYVEKVENGLITVIEGNSGRYGNVARRTLTVNGKYIRGYIIPKYTGYSPVQKTTTTALTIHLPDLHKGDHGDAVRVWQTLIRAKDDGDFGNDTEERTKEWQKANGKKVDGWVGKGCWSKMFQKEGWM